MNQPPKILYHNLAQIVGSDNIEYDEKS